MKYCRFLFEGQPHYGKVEERGNEPWIVDLATAPPEDLGTNWPGRAHPRLSPIPRDWISSPFR